MSEKKRTDLVHAPIEINPKKLDQFQFPLWITHSLFDELFYGNVSMVTNSIATANDSTGGEELKKMERRTL